MPGSANRGQSRRAKAGTSHHGVHLGRAPTLQSHAMQSQPYRHYMKVQLPCAHEYQVHESQKVPIKFSAFFFGDTVRRPGHMPAVSSLQQSILCGSNHQSSTGLQHRCLTCTPQSQNWEEATPFLVLCRVPLSDAMTSPLQCRTPPSSNVRTKTVQLRALATAPWGTAHCLTRGNRPQHTHMSISYTTPDCRCASRRHGMPCHLIAPAMSK